MCAFLLDELRHKSLGSWTGLFCQVKQGMFIFQSVLEVNNKMITLFCDGAML